ncbi:DUF6319 family protein [Gordonia crocea]|uniref:Translation initiation factor n=1 Tax=Gordonia crocea TaxID=589162 RepID=A0A7I9V188_9ACTN|nr:DUF6319 family protein [Gordonia crocea]GED98903.1 hypothetical protein nbrc107697_29420 [Gordonia crocea]
MPPRRRPAADSLTPENLAALATALAEGKRATVYLRDGIPGLGLAAGTSAKVISIDGSTVTIRPRGVDDELPYEADELRITKDAPAKPAPAKAAPAKPKPAPTPAAPRSTPPPQRPPSPPTPSPPAAPARPASGARKNAKPKSVTVTIFGSSDNEWSVAVTTGARKPNQSRSVTPGAVENALRGLGDEAALAAAESVLAAAREEAARKVEELRRELAAAQETLAALSGD